MSFYNSIVSSRLVKVDFPILESTKDQRRYRELQQQWSRLFQDSEMTERKI